MVQHACPRRPDGSLSGPGVCVRGADAGARRPVKALCISIHDVAPATWGRCARLIEHLDRAGPFPLTLLVVPHYRGVPSEDPRFLEALRARVARGDELALHGWTHVDDRPVPGALQGLKRTVYCDREGEFAALDAREAADRVARGIDWFRGHGFALHGFVPPAYLMADRARSVLAAMPFDYTARLGSLELLPEGARIASPPVMYSARSALRGAMSLGWNGLLGPALAPRPLARVGLHPIDVEHPSLVRQAERLIERLARDRAAMTKAGFAALWRRARIATSDRVGA